MIVPTNTRPGDTLAAEVAELGARVAKLEDELRGLRSYVLGPGDNAPTSWMPEVPK